MPRQIDYRLRPAKHVERKMIARALLRLRHFESLETYAYVGFGALYFSDFKVMHELGIQHMKSIEIDAPIERFENNAPFSCVNVLPGSSHDVLPTLPWDRKTITWLDYTDHLDADKLGDVTVVTEQAQSGNVLLLTVSEAHSGSMEEALTALRRRISDKADLPAGRAPELEQLGSAAGRAEIDRLVVVQRIEDALSSVNAGRDPDDRLRYEQLFYFTYSDGRPMATFGGVFVAGRDARHFHDAAFGELDFVKRGKDPYRIPRPLLTHKEMIELDAQLPADAGPPTVKGVDAKTIEDYEKVYVYFPRFVEASL